MSAMRLVSEQSSPSKSCDAECATDSRYGPGGEGAVSMEALAALLWATYVIDRDAQRQLHQQTADVDAATHLRHAVTTVQDTKEMSELFGGKTLDHWRLDGFTHGQTAEK